MTNPTESDVERALWSTLNGVAPTWAIKLPGIDFKPSGAPWQRGTWMPNRPAVVAMGEGAYHRQSGVYQIDLFVPKSHRRADELLERATAVRQAFYDEDAQGGVIDAGGGQLVVDARPFVSAIDESDSAYNRVFVEVVVRIELPPA